MFVGVSTWKTAFNYLAKAGDEVAAAFTNQEALDYYVLVLEVCDKTLRSDLLSVNGIKQWSAPTSAALAE